MQANNVYVVCHISHFLSAFLHGSAAFSSLASGDANDAESKKPCLTPPPRPKKYLFSPIATIIHGGDLYAKDGKADSFHVRISRSKLKFGL